MNGDLAAGGEAEVSTVGAADNGRVMRVDAGAGAELGERVRRDQGREGAESGKKKREASHLDVMSALTGEQSGAREERGSF